MSLARILSRPQPVRGGLDMAFEKALQEFHGDALSLNETEIEGMAQLISEHGVRGPIVTMQFALYYVGINPEWKIEKL